MNDEEIVEDVLQEREKNLSLKMKMKLLQMQLLHGKLVLLAILL